MLSYGLLPGTQSVFPLILQLQGGLTSTLLKAMPVFHKIFMKHYSEHHCRVNGCSEVLVLDGNMKNHRDVCFATCAGYTEFDGLPGKIMSGCPNTPDFKSRFCSLHNATAVIPKEVDSQQLIMDKTADSNVESPAAVILGKRSTRHSNFYQVVWLGKSLAENSWEPESSLPKELVTEYEEGIMRVVIDDNFTSGYQIIHTLSSAVIEHTDEPQEKRPRMDKSFSPHSTGAFVSNDMESHSLKCNTEKDKHIKLNYKTAGILAGVWPCGTVTLIGELYGAESKSQVYGLTHSFLYNNQKSTEDLKIICYDDGCHLLKYAANKCRSNLTETAVRLSHMKIVIDRMHFKGHIDQWCRENCNPDSVKELQDVNTEVCEQTFSWLSQYAKITRRMNRQHFLFYIIYLCELRNRHKAC